MAAVRVLVGRMGLAVGLLIGLGTGALWWAGHADAAGAPDTAYTAVTPCVVFDSRASQGASGGWLGPFNGGDTKYYTVSGTFPAEQGGGNTNCGVPLGATSVEINVVAVNALNEGNLRVTDGSPASTGGVVNYNAMSPKLNTANAVIVPLTDGRLMVSPNCGVGCTVDTTDVRGVVLGYFSTALSQRVTALDQRVVAQDQRLKHLEFLLAGVTRTIHNGYNTLRFNQVNLQLTNGTNSTYMRNGYGNLIVGYDTSTPGTIRSGSHNIVVGDGHGWYGSGGVVFGRDNLVNGHGATVTGGRSNRADWHYASVSGGNLNTANGLTSSVSGGRNNQASADYSSVSGGFSGLASGPESSVTGGVQNRATGISSSVTGGQMNEAAAYASVVSGGGNKTMSTAGGWRAGDLIQ